MALSTTTLIKLLIGTVAILGLMFPNVHAGGYTKHCYSCNMNNSFEQDPNGNLLACECITEDRNWVKTYTTAHLNEKLRNKDGNFVWGPDRPGHRGGHRETCKYYDLKNGHIYSAMCWKSDHDWVETSINLDLHISMNDHAELVMDD